MRVALALALAIAVAPVPAETQAAEPESVSVGVHAFDWGSFENPRFQAVGFRRVRYIVRWDVARTGSEARYLDRYMREARLRGIEILVHFNRRDDTRRGPSVGEYTRAFKAFRKRWPAVKTFGAWNEANHRDQPTFKKPKLAAQYYNALRKACRTCRIVAADVLDDSNMVRWLKKFKRYAKKPRIWGLHNYRDTNPRRGQEYGGTKRFLRTTKRGEVWFTETGGLVTFRLPSGGLLFPTSEDRANYALRKMFRLAKKYRKRVRRIYIYDWQQPQYANRFDSGLLRKNGTTRPGYETVRRNLTRKPFRP